ncbi:MAG: aldehyde dehydrogenase family protein [SAR324 cluster bacterium]|nr:aldehyde dehydrogenase family protein [SAR324 cluster bacterium]
MAFTAKLLINGESVDGAGESLAVQNPSTGSTICEVPEATAEQVEATVRAARDA